MFKSFRLLAPTLLILAVSSCSIFKSIPQPRTEFRGFWVATVVNIDWPKSGNDTNEKQKRDFLQILDFYEDLNFNAAIVQIRTAGDAFYRSEHAPWSRYLTGEEGSIDSNKDLLLDWMIAETHKRGMEFHAWLNPYRATFDLNTESLSDTHDYNLHPDWMIKYGKKYYYDPGLPHVREHLVSVIDEVIENHDVDAIHFDDYFYPYKIKDEVFQDSISYYNCALPNQDLEDWRRSNIDSLIKNSHATIKARKPWVQFGVSPFGVWKNKSTDPSGSDTEAGQTTYEDLYADPLLWMEKGWLDYLIPQAYWSMELPVASHSKIVDWWSSNSQNTNLYIGNGPYKIRNNSDKAWNRKRELPDQIRYAREKSAVQGNAFFSAKSLMHTNADVVRHLKRKYYKRQALPPISPHVENVPKVPVSIKSIKNSGSDIVVKFSSLKAFRYVLRYRSKKSREGILSTKKLIDKNLVFGDSVVIPSHIMKRNKRIVLTFVDFYGRESKPISVHLNQTYLNDPKR